VHGLSFYSSHDPIPITIITGYLGAGKTTLLNNILGTDHGRRIAVLLNEFGEIGIDGEIVVNLEEEQEVYTLSNGCICCTVREDLIEAVEGLLARRDRFDRIVIETTGLAEPGPAVMALLNHPEIEESFRVDGVVTVADARHLPEQMERGSEAGAQIAYADRILLNKIDLVSADQIIELEERIRRINPIAPIERTTSSATDIDRLLDIGGFDVERIDRDVRSAATSSGRPHDTDHHEHLHHEGIGSVSIRMEGSIDREKFDAWIDALLEREHRKIYRIKGILDVADTPRRLVVQGVHALHTWQFGSSWEADAARGNRIVFIGRELEGMKLREGLEGVRS
jgi:G3E family GTPase